MAVLKKMFGHWSTYILVHFSWGIRAYVLVRMLLYTFMNICYAFGEFYDLVPVTGSPISSSYSHSRIDLVFIFSNTYPRMCTSV